MIYLPGTKIYSQALEEGWIDDKVKDIFLKGIAGVEDNIYNRILFLIAVTKERGVTVPDRLLDHILEAARKNNGLSEEFIDFVISCINTVEKHHGVDF